MDILNVKQESNKTLSDYVTRFTSETLRLGCSPDELIRTAFHNGLRVGPLYDKLVRHPPQTSHDMWTTVQKYVASEDSAQRKAEYELGVGKSDLSKNQDRGEKGRNDRLNKGRLEPKMD